MKTLEFLPATVETKSGPVKVHKLLVDINYHDKMIDHHDKFIDYRKKLKSP